MIGWLRRRKPTVMVCRRIPYWRSASHGGTRVALEAAHGLYETNFRDVEKLVEIALEVDPENTETIYFLIELRLTTREGDAALGLLG